MMTDVYSEENAFMVQKVSKQEASDTYFVSSALQVLKKLAEIFKAKR